MPGIADIFARFMDEPLSVLKQNSVSQTSPVKQTSVVRAAEQKRARLDGNSVRQAASDAAAGQVGDNGAASASELENDIRYLEPVDLILKYGYDEAMRLQREGLKEVRRLRNLESTDRSGVAGLGDTINSIGSGFVNGLGGLTALGAGIVDPEAGAAVSDVLNEFNELADSQRSDASRNRRYVNSEISRLDQRDNKARYERDFRDDGLAAWRRVGRDAVDGFRRSFEDPITTLDNTSEAVGSLASGSVLAAGLRKIGQKVLGAAAKGGVLAGAAGSERAGRAFAITSKGIEKASLPVAVGLTEGGGAYQSTFREMLARGFSEEEANEAALQAAAIQAPIGALTGTIVSRFERNPLRVGSTREAASNILREIAEEGIQSGAGQTAQNYAVRGFDENKDILEGIGDQIGRGAAAGGLAAGAIQAPGVAVRAPLEVAEATGRAAIEGAKKLAAPVIARGQKIIDEIEARLPESQGTVQGVTDEIKAQVQTLVTIMIDKSAPVRERLRAALTLRKEAPESIPDNELNTLVNEARITPEQIDVTNPDDVTDMVTLAEEAPDKIDPEISKKILFHAEQGELPLDPPNLAALRAAIELAEIKEQYTQQAEQIGGKSNIDVVSEAIQLDSGDTAQPSAAEHLRLINRAMRAGDTETAKRQLGQLVSFATVLNNKVDALNRNLREGDGRQENGSTYMNFTSRGVWRESAIKLFVNPVAPKTVQFAQRVANDARAVTTLANNLATIFPELEVQPVNPVDLDAALQGDAIEIAKRARAAKQTAPAAAPVPASTPVPAEQANLEGGDQSTDPEVNQEPNLQPSSEAEASPAASEASSQEEEKAERLAAKKTARTKLEKSTKPGQFKSAQPLPESEPDLNFYRFVTKDGKAVEGLFRYDPETKAIDSLDIGDSRNPTEIGPTEVADLLGQLLTAFPEAESLEAFRYTGARSEPQLIKRDKKALDKFREKRAGKDIDQEPEPQAVQTEEEVPVEAAQPQEAAPVAATGSADSGVPDVDPSPEAADELDVSTVRGKFPRLVKTSVLDKAFKIGKKIKTRIFKSKTPVADVREALKSQESFEAFIGKSSRKQLTPLIIKEYQQLFGKSVEIYKILDENLQAFIKKNQAKLQDSSLWINGKAMNIVEELDDGTLAYNPELIGSAILASLQWLLTANRYSRSLDAEEVSKILQIPQHLITDEQVTFMEKGLSLTEVKRSLARDIARYWGLEAEANIDLGLTKGIPEAVAAEIIRALNHPNTNLMDSGRTNPQLRMKIEQKDVDRYVPYPFVQTELKAFPTAIEEAVLIDPEPDLYVGEAPTKIAATQLNNPKVQNSKQQRAAITAEQNTGFKLDKPMSEILIQMGKDAVLSLFGEGDLSKRTLNEQHHKTLEGRNLTLAGAYDALASTVARVQNYAGESDPYEVEIHYAANISSIGRMQVDGGFNPQASKLMREAVLPTRTKLDLTKPENRSGFELALAQALGIKVENNLREQAVSQVLKKLQNEFAPAVDILLTWLENGGTKPLKPSEVDTIRDVFGEPVEVVAFHALLDYARSLLAKDQTSFETSLYVEADGITNGPSNAVLIATPGAFTEDNLVNMEKGGVFLRDDLTMNEHRQTDEGRIDFYTKASLKLAGEISGMRGQLDNDTGLQMNVLLRAMNRFLPGVTYTKEDGLVVDRKVTKNPMTITLYGSGARGIAGNLVYELTRNVYAKLSEALERQASDPQLSFAEAMFGDEASPGVSAEQIYEQFKSVMEVLATNVTYFDRDEGKLKTFRPQESISPTGYENPKFEFNQNQLEKMESTMRWLFVEPMRQAISETVGPQLISSIDAIRDATQVVGIFGKYRFLSNVDQALRKKKPSEFLSQAETDQAFDEALSLGLKIETGDQTFMPSGSENINIGTKEFGRAFDDSGRTDAFIYGPRNPGVSGIPTLIVGMGDGSMIQKFLTASNAVLRSLRVFDGINLPLDQIEEGSRQANQAAWEAMIGNNPLRAVADSFAQLMQNKTLDGMSPEMADELIRALGVSTVEEIPSALEALQEIVETYAKDIEARHQVLRRIKVSVDQMASVGVPFKQDGDIDLTGLSPREAAARLNELFVEERQKLGAVVTVSEQIGDALAAIGTQDPRSGVTTLSHNQLKSLLPKLGISDEQQRMLREIVRSLVTKRYRIVSGSRPQMEVWASKNAAQELPVETQLTGKIQGFTAFGDKTVYLVNSSSETLTHELIHAATFEQIVAYYRGETTGKEQTEAIKRIEELMSQFLALDNETEIPVYARQAYTDTKRTITKALRSNDALNKAVALNEFMAWGLSNRNLIKLQQSTKASPLVQLAKDVLEAIKKLIWGRRHSPKVADDMHSNLEFNTAILINSAPSVQEMLGDAVLFHSMFEEGERLPKITRVFQEKITSYLDWTLEDLSEKSSAFLRATQLGVDQAEIFQANGFSMNTEEANAFKMIVAVLSTQAKLDPNSLAEIQDLFRHATDNLTPQSFMSDPDSTDQNEVYLAQQRYNAIVGNFGRLKDAEGRSTLLPSFLALSIVSEDFRKVLAKIPVQQPELEKWNTLDGILENVGNSMMDKLSATMAGADRNAPDVKAAITALTARLINVAQAKPSFVDQALGPIGSILNKSNEIVVSGMQALGQQAQKSAALIESKTTNRFANFGAGLLNIVGAVLDEQQADEIHSGIVSRMNRTKFSQTFRELIVELVGRTHDNASIYDMIKRVRSIVQQTRQQFREHLPEVLRAKFSRELDDNEWTTLFKGMAKTDLAALDKFMPVSKMLRLLQDPGLIGNEINVLEEKVQSLDSNHWLLIQKKARELAEFMNTGKVPGNLLRNARAVANLYGEVRPGSAQAAPELIRAVDQLVTLYALQGLPQERRDGLQKLAQDEPQGVSFALSYLVGQRNDELSKVDSSSLAKANHYKGFIPSESRSGGSLIVSEDNKAGKLLLMGYKRLETYKGSDSEVGIPSMGYYYAPSSGRAMFKQGILQNVRPTAAGVDPLTGFTNIASTAGQITEPTLVKLINRRLRQNGTNAEGLMPVYNETGHVVAFERSIDPQQELKLERDTDLARAMGVWAGRQVEEMKAEAVNQGLIRALRVMYDRDKLYRQDEYVNLFSKITDPVLRDAVNLINRQTRNTIELEFGPREFWVRKDMLNDALGYRKASIGDLWTENTRWSPEVQKTFRALATGILGAEAFQRLVAAEKFVENVITDARVTIVVKSIIVPAANLASNFIQLMSRGVNIADIARGMPRKAAEVTSYIKNRIRKIELEAELRAVENDPTKARRLKAEIQSLSDAERRLSIWPLIEAGEFTSISDVALSNEEIDLAEGRLAAYIEKLTDKLPDGLKTVGKYGVVAKDTALFRGLRRAVEYGDFLGKAVLYDHLTQKKGLKPAAALAEITEEFINYDRLAGRTRDYLENIGLMWFWNFKIRSAKIGANIIRNNPVNAFLALAVPGAVGIDLPGSPVFDNGFAVMADGRLSYSLGFDQLFAAHSLNPWVNMVS
jgi:hypothetical protein